MRINLDGQHVRIYWNFHRKVFSVQVKVAGRWKVCDYANHLALISPIFKISNAGRIRVRREGRKNVHAFIEGILVSPFGADALEHMEMTEEYRISYDPYKNATFQAYQLGKEVEQACDCNIQILQASVREGRPILHGYAYPRVNTQQQSCQPTN